MNKELLFSITKKDFEIQYFSGTGAGGQHRNKHQNCVRLRHPASGAYATGQQNRERLSNVRDAFNALIKHPKFRLWYNQKTMEILTGKSIDERVDEMMDNKNLKIETRNDSGRWASWEGETCHK